MSAMTLETLRNILFQAKVTSMLGTHIHISVADAAEGIQTIDAHLADKAGSRVDGFDYKAAYVRKVESISAIAELLGVNDSDGSDDSVVQAVKAMLEAAPQPCELVGEAVAVRYPDGRNIDGTQHYVYYGLPRHQPGHGAEELYVHPQPDAARDADARKAFALDALIAAGYVDQLKADEAMDLWPEYSIDKAMAAERGEAR